MYIYSHTDKSKAGQINHEFQLFHCNLARHATLLKSCCYTHSLHCVSLTILTTLILG